MATSVSAEVADCFGGPCRGRTYGPLIKSEAEGVAQVVDSLGNPRSHCGAYLEGSLPLFVSLSRVLPAFAGHANTVLTPDKPGKSKGRAFGLGGDLLGTRRLAAACIEQTAR